MILPTKNNSDRCTTCTITCETGVSITGSIPQATHSIAIQLHSAVPNNSIVAVSVHFAAEFPFFCHQHLHPKIAVFSSSSVHIEQIVVIVGDHWPTQWT